MPDLNLQDDEGARERPEGTDGTTDELTESMETSEEVKGSKGGLFKVLIIIVGVLVLGGGTVFLLNSLGIVKLWGTKSTPTVVQYEEPATGTEQPTEIQQHTPEASREPAMIETPALDEPKKEPVKTEARPAAPVTSQPAGNKTMPTQPASSKLSEMKGEYTVQVSAWREEATAQEIVKRLEAAGYPAFVEERTYKDGTWYTVRIGRYPTRKDAQLAVAHFAEELQANHWIDRVRSK
jgi:cell division septation protein DedD